VILDNVTRPVARVVAPATVRGLEHLRHAEPPLIFAANHASHLDTPLLLTTLPAHIRHHTVVAAASDYFFDRTWKSVVWSFALAAIPIERSRVNRRSADVAAELLEDGWNLVIFPEGGRSPDGWAQPFRGGAAYLGRRTGCPVVPVYLHGTRHILPKAPQGDPAVRPGSGVAATARRPPRRAPVTVLFGTPLRADPDEDARRFGLRVERAVAVLADEIATDWWSARRAACVGDLEALRGPAAAAWRRSWALDRDPGTAGGAEGGPSLGRSWPKY
jgi:1-acyl-sn-glycerol-3-phosphate acyltransferase